MREKKCYNWDEKRKTNLEVGQLQCHLYESVWRHADVFHMLFAVLSED